MANLRMDTDLLRQRSAGYSQWAEDLAATPANYDGYRDHLYRQGAIAHQVSAAATEVFDSMKQTYERCAEHRQQTANGLSAAADRFEAQEERNTTTQRAVGDTPGADGYGPSGPPMTDVQGGMHEGGLEPLPYPGPARTYPMGGDEYGPTQPPMTDVQSGIQQGGIELPTEPGPARTYPMGQDS